ncbi:MAG: EpsG family protein [Bacteroidetes bacterium]|nr:EpsG family protein [Bacteroidota bacterium]
MAEMHLCVCRKRKIFVLVLVLFMSVLAGYKIFGESRDYYNYSYFFDEYRYPMQTRMEPGFVGLVYLIKIILKSNIQLLLFMVSCIGLGMKMLIISRYRNWIIMILWYLFLLYPLHELTQLRLAVGSAFLYWSIYYFSEGNRRNGHAMMFISSLFHYSCLVLYPLMLLAERVQGNSVKKSLINFAVLILFVSSFMFWNDNAGFVSLFRNFNPMLDRYVGDASLYYDIPTIVNSKTVVTIFLIMIGFKFYKKIGTSHRLWFWVSVYGITMYYLLNRIPVLSQRIYEMTMFSYLIWVFDLPGIYRHVGVAAFTVMIIYLFIDMVYYKSYFL